MDAITGLADLALLVRYNVLSISSESSNDAVSDDILSAGGKSDKNKENI